MRYVMTLADDRHAIIGLPGFVSSLLGAVLGHLPGKVLTTDNVRSMSVDNVTDAARPRSLAAAPRWRTSRRLTWAASRRLTNSRWHGKGRH